MVHLLDKGYPARVHKIATAALALMAWISWAGEAHAHVAPALDANNRYLRVNPMADRVRLAYTVYIGEIPGSEARRHMDQNGDGTISENESSAYGKKLAAAVLNDLEIMWDNAPYKLSWSEIYVGLGTPVSHGGSFSVDMIGWICGQKQATHEMSLFDRYRVPRPGEGELRVQQSPGITITRAALGHDTPGAQLEIKWQGNDGPLTSLGFFLEFAVDPETAAPGPPGECLAKAAEKPQKHNLAVVLVIAAAIAGLLLVGMIRHRRQNRETQRPENTQD